MGVFNAEKATLWSQRMAAFDASGQSRRAWCKSQGLSVATFGYWRGRLGDRADATANALTRPRWSRGASDKISAATATVVPVVVRSASPIAPAPSPASSGTTPAVELAWPNGLRLTTTLGIAELAALVRALSC